MNADRFGLIEESIAPITASAVAQQKSYWSPAKLQEAKPVPMPTITVAQHDLLARKIAEESASTVADALTVPPVIPGQFASPSSTPARSTNLVADTLKYPYSVVGKLFMSIMGTGSSFQGSAWIVGRKCILTAGHCVYDRAQRRFYNNVQFIPQFKNGATPLGTWNVTQITTLKEYTTLRNGEELVYDIGACILDKPLPESLGIAGYTMNQPLAKGKMRSVGYPAQPTGQFPFDGKRLWESVGDYNDEEDPAAGITSPRNYPMYCDLTGGCSGGPIFETDDNPVVVGLNSHIRLVSANGPPEHPPRMFSPYFGDAIGRLVAWMKQNGGEPNEPGFDPRGNGQQDGGHDAHPLVEIKSGLMQVVENLNTLIGKL